MLRKRRTRTKPSARPPVAVPPEAIQLREQSADEPGTEDPKKIFDHHYSVVLDLVSLHAQSGLFDELEWSLIRGSIDLLAQTAGATYADERATEQSRLRGTVPIETLTRNAEAVNASAEDGDRLPKAIACGAGNGQKAAGISSNMTGGVLEYIAKMLRDKIDSKIQIVGDGNMKGINCHPYTIKLYAQDLQWEQEKYGLDPAKHDP